MPSLLLVVCLKLALVGPAMVPVGLIGKRLGFRDATMADAIAGIFEVGTSIALVLAGYGVFGLVWGTTTRAFVYLLVVFTLEPIRPSFRIPFAEVGGAIWFGLHVVASNLVYQLYRNMDYFLIGLRLGVEPLGVYRVGFEVGMSPSETTAGVAIRAAYPVLASVSQDPPAIREAFAGTARSLWLFLLPIAGLIAIEGHDLVATIAAPRWLAAVPVVQVLCWAGVIRGLVQL
nr:oligosaccharide flippase family protein [Chthoniobacterales bacterium]